MTLQFGHTILKKVSLEGQVISIGRSPRRSVLIDNPAVSHQHPKVYAQDYDCCLEDLGSLNGAHLNSRQVNREILRDDDTVGVGKHTLQFSANPGEPVAANPIPPVDFEEGPAVDKLEVTMVLDTRAARAQKAKVPPKMPAAGESLQVGKVIVLRSKTTANEYLFSSQTSIIGNSLTTQTTPVNGRVITGRQELQDGDLINFCCIELQFLLVPW